jgi:hypothetical protein
MVADGMVSLLGICEAAPDTIRRANAVHALTAVQSEYCFSSAASSSTTSSQQSADSVSDFVAFSRSVAGSCPGTSRNVFAPPKRRGVRTGLEQVSPAERLPG